MYRFLIPGLLAGSAAGAQTVSSSVSVPSLAEIQTLEAQVDRQEADLASTKARLHALEDQVLGTQRARGAEAQLDPPKPIPGAPTQGTASPEQTAHSAQTAPAPDQSQPVGQAPAPRERQAEVAVLSEQGGIITRRGRFTVEPALEYARSDRNTVIFRGIEVPTSVLVGVFDINETRSDIVTASIAARYGLSSRLELNVRAPFVYRADSSVLAPVTTGGGGTNAVTTPNVAARGHDIGDIEFGARYQFTSGTHGFPILIGGLQVVSPTGTNPFTTPRDPGTGVALASATGGGFWGVTPTITALLPSDPAVLFGSLGYTHNFGRGFDGVQLANDVLVDYVKPGDAVQGSAGIGISLNPRVAVSFGYAQSWSFGTRTQGRILQTSFSTGAVTGSTPYNQTTRDLQIGRFLFGVSYRTAAATTINWNVEVGATRDAADVRTTLRLPITFGN